MVSPLGTTRPLTSAETPNSSPTFCRFTSFPLNWNAERRDFTLSCGTWMRLSVSDSVMPSLRYSVLVSPLPLMKGSTAMESIGAVLPERRYQEPPAVSAIAIIHTVKTTQSFRCLNVFADRSEEHTSELQS